jgi:urease accessory protein
MIATAQSITRNAPGPFDAEISLDYEARLLRRKRIACKGGDFLVDLPEVTSLEDGDAFELSDGRVIAVRAAPEPVLVIRGHLARLAWHIGNRHTPCRIEADRLVIRQDHVVEAMLRQLGAQIVAMEMPFRPEGGAYGHGRTFGHDHGHSHAPADGHHHHDHHHAPAHRHDAVLLHQHAPAASAAGSGVA